jgi:hypothetical protein
MKAALKHSDVVFMYNASDEVYRAYGATFVGWGRSRTPEEVARHHKLGIRCASTMWCLTAGARQLHERPDLMDAVARDIEGKAIAVPWRFDQIHDGTGEYFGCTNHPAFRAHNREMVRRVMAGGADGLQVDDHLGAAHPAWYLGGCFCDHCMKAFAAYLKKHSSPSLLKKAGVRSWNGLDYRDIVRKHARTAKQYTTVRNRIPLMDEFLRFHAEAAAANVRELGELAAEVAGHPVLLSANACLPTEPHERVTKHLTHIICEVGQYLPGKTYAKGFGNAIKAYGLADKLGKPMACTALGHDWSYVKDHKSLELVRFWIAVAYAHGQRFMVPHPTGQWCYDEKRGSHWYAAPVKAFAPMYRFIRSNAQWFDGFESVKVKGIRKPANVLCAVRRNRKGGALVVHVVDTAYDEKKMRMRPKSNVRIELPRQLLMKKPATAQVLSYDGSPRNAVVKTSGGKLTVDIGELRLWSLIVFA